MPAELEEIIHIAEKELVKLVPKTSMEVEEIELRHDSGHAGHYEVTFSYWARDTKPLPENPQIGHVISMATRLESKNDFFNPWRKRYKRVEVDPEQEKVIAIRMYEPPLGVS